MTRSIGGFHRNQFSPDRRVPDADEMTAAVPNHPVFIMESFSGPGATNARGKAILEANGVVVGADGSVGANAPSCRRSSTCAARRRASRCCAA